MPIMPNTTRTTISMAKRGTWIAGLLVCLAAGLPLPAMAQNEVVGAPFHLFPGGPWVRDLIFVNGAGYFDIQARQGRSYCVETHGTDLDGVGLFALDTRVTVYNALTETNPIGTNDNIGTEPDGQFMSRFCWIAPAPPLPFSPTLIKVDNLLAGNFYYHIRVVETTLWSSWFFQGGDYNAFVLLRNTTDGSCTYNITWRDAAGSSLGSTGNVAVPGNGGVGTNSRSVVPATNINGTAEIAHDCSPDALVGQITSLSAAEGLGFDAPMFQRRPW